MKRKERRKGRRKKKYGKEEEKKEKDGKCRNKTIIKKDKWEKE